MEITSCNCYMAISVWSIWCYLRDCCDDATGEWLGSVGEHERLECKKCMMIIWRLSFEPSAWKGTSRNIMFFFQTKLYARKKCWMNRCSGHESCAGNNMFQAHVLFDFAANSSLQVMAILQTQTYSKHCTHTRSTYICNVACFDPPMYIRLYIGILCGIITWVSQRGPLPKLWSTGMVKIVLYPCFVCCFMLLRPGLE